MRRLLYVSLVLLATAAIAHAQMMSAAADRDRAKPEPKVTRLSLQPMATPEPALRYRVLPPLSELTAGNAATLYYAAAHMEPTQADWEKISPTKKEEDWGTLPLEVLPGDEIRQMLGKYHLFLKQLDKAARRRDCDWELPIREENFGMRLPALTKFQQYARLLRIKARLEIAEGRYDAAVRTLQTGFAMSRHISRAPTLIHGLVGIAVAGNMCRCLEDLVATPGAPNLYWALTDLPRPFIDLRAAFETEASMVFFMIPELRDVRTAKYDARTWRHVLSRTGPLLMMPPREQGPGDVVKPALMSMVFYTRAKAYLRSIGYTPDAVERLSVPHAIVLSWVEHYERQRDDMLKWLALPYPEAQEGLKAAERGMHPRRADAFPFSSLLPAYRRAQLAQAATDRQISLLRCIEALRLHAATHDGTLPEKLDDITEVPVPRDPLSGKLFIYKRTDASATLEPSSTATPGRHHPRYELTIRTKRD